MLAEKISLRGIARVLEISRQSVLNIAREHWTSVPLLSPEEQADLAAGGKLEKTEDEAEASSFSP
jgi:hypothetical protein